MKLSFINFHITDIHVILAVLSILTLSRLFAKYYYPAEIMSHFTLQYAIASLAFILIYMFCKEWLWALASLAVFFINFFPVMMLLFPRYDIEHTDNYEDITILQFNINYSNKKAEKFAGWINNFDNIDSDFNKLSAEHRPDIIVIQEASFPIAYKLRSLNKLYPNQIVRPEAGAFGVMILSRLPINYKIRKGIGDGWDSYSVGHFETASKKIPFNIAELHAIPPIGKEMFENRNYEFEFMARLVTELDSKNKILIGDLNVTPYSPYYKMLEKNSGLDNAMRGTGIKGTWPNFLPFFMRIPIDHMLVSKSIEVMGRKVVPSIGSDHLPVITRLRIYN